MAEKIYVGRAKQQKALSFELIKLSFSAADLKILESNLNERGYVNLDMTKRKEEGKYGDTHSLAIDTWKKPADAPKQAQESKMVNRNGIETPKDDLPF